MAEGIIPYDLTPLAKPAVPYWQPLRNPLPGQPGYSAWQAKIERERGERIAANEEAARIALEEWTTVWLFHFSSVDHPSRRVVTKLLEQHKPEPCDQWHYGAECPNCVEGIDAEFASWPCDVFTTIRDASNG